MPWNDGFTKYLVTGEVDLSGNLCGFVTATGVYKPEMKYEGTFFNGKKHGFGMLLCMRDEYLSLFL